MRSFNAFSKLIFVLILAIGGGLSYSMYSSPADTGRTTVIIIITFIVAIIVSASIKVADQWEKAVVLRLGKFHGLKGPGLFFIIPVIDAVR